MAHIIGPPAKRSLGGKRTLLPPLYPRPAGAPPEQEPSDSLMGDLGLSLEIGVTQMGGGSLLGFREPGLLYWRRLVSPTQQEVKEYLLVKL